MSCSAQKRISLEINAEICIFNIFSFQCVWVKLHVILPSFFGVRSKFYEVSVICNFQNVVSSTGRLNTQQRYGEFEIHRVIKWVICLFF